MMRMMWKDVAEYEDSYEVSNCGNIRNKKTRRILKQRVDMYGYRKVGLCKNGKVKTFLVHRLVATAFIPNPDNKPQVNHKDTNKQNNYVYNLEWNTSKENINHADANKIYKNKRLSQEEVIKIRASKGTYKELAERYGVSPTTIYHVTEKMHRYANM